MFIIVEIELALRSLGEVEVEVACQPYPPVGGEGWRLRLLSNFIYLALTSVLTLFIA